MCKKLQSLTVLLLVFGCAFSQGVGVGTTKPDSSAALDVTATDKGLLIPRMNLASILAILRPAKGLFAYDSIAGRLMVNIGNAAAPNWQPVASNNSASGNGSGWSLIGNVGINPTAQFVGTTDNRSLRFRVNNTAAGELQPATGNIFLGPHAGQPGTVGFSTIAIGPGALQTDSTTGNLVAIGDSALFSSDKGADNTAIGSKALLSNTQGTSNTGIGSNALFLNTTGQSNTGTGAQPLVGNTTGQFNVADGFQSLFVNDIGQSNTAVGHESLFSNGPGLGNTAVGSEALFNNSTGNSNTATGHRAMLLNFTGQFNVAIGDSALLANTAASDNTAIGFRSMLRNNNTSGNTVIGTDALFSIVGTRLVHSSHIAIGQNALFNLTSGAQNIGLGINTLEIARDGFDDVAVGVRALRSTASTLGENTAVGVDAAGNENVVEENTTIGRFAVTLDDGISCVALGSNAANTVLNDEVMLGNPATTSIGGAVNFSKLSDGRFKKNIRANIPGIGFIMKLRPVTYQVDLPSLNKKIYAKTGGRPPSWKGDDAAGEFIHSGFIAQEVEQAAKEMGFDFSGVNKPQQEGGLYSLRYASFVMPLVKAVQEQQHMVDQLRQGNADLEKQLDMLKKTAADRRALKEDLLRRIGQLEAGPDTKN